MKKRRGDDCAGTAQLKRKMINMTATSTRTCLREDPDWVQAESDDASGITVECVCPKCGTAHQMKLFWSGRGKPKKFCPPCRGFVASIESLDLCSLSAEVHRGLEA
jgi:hypothetical protein